MALNGQPITRFAKNALLAATIGAGGSILVNTVRRDSERAKKILCYTAVSGLTGLSVGCTYAAIRKQNLFTYSLSTGVSFFTISGMFFVALLLHVYAVLLIELMLLVIRDNLLVSSRVHEWRHWLDKMQGNPTLSMRQQAMTSMQASAISGGVTGMLLSCAIWRGPSIALLNIAQGVLIAAVGQWSVDKCRLWILEETIKYHYPKLVANAKRNEESWEKWMMRKLTGRSYGSLLKEKLRSCEIQLQILEEEETRLLRLIEQRDNEKSRQERDET